MRKFLLLFLLLGLNSCDLINKLSSTPPSTGNTALAGEASYYADKFQGRTTANGERYDKNKLTAAHKTLSFGTKVEVTHIKNGKKVTVRINDRLPASSKRVIDLSRAAARKLNMIQSGIADVTLKNRKVVRILPGN